MTIERSINNNTPNSKSESPLESLQAARTLQKLRRSHGVDRVDLIVEDVDGNWLEQWGEEFQEGQQHSQITDQDPSLLD